MSGKKETLVEKITRPIRVNPIGNVIGGVVSILGAMRLSFANSQASTESGKGIVALGVTYLLISLGAAYHNYRRDRTLLEDWGFDREHFKSRMPGYCRRQSFYVAAVNTGYRNEAKELINATPTDDKDLAFLPHF